MHTNNYLAKVGLLAELFHKRTGMAAPKCNPDISGQSAPSDEERAYAEWYADFAVNDIVKLCLDLQTESVHLEQRVEAKENEIAGLQISMRQWRTRYDSLRDMFDAANQEIEDLRVQLWGKK